MTREELLSLPAGEALDRLVAEQVAGLTRCGPPLADWMYWLLDGTAEPLPDYSVSIEEAWRVLEQVADRRRTLNPVRLSQTLKGWCCRIRTGVYTHVRADGETAPLAICRALLLARLDADAACNTTT